jgi:elongation factor G
MDYLEQEQKRGITITSAATKFAWADFEINLIDTPGHIDFTAEVERSLRVLDGAVAVFDGSEGVQAQSETVWKQGRKYHLPFLCFINKMDKVGADFEMSVKSIAEKLEAGPLVLQLPVGAGKTFSGIIDLLKMKAVFYDSQKLGAVFEEKQIPKELLAQAEHHRQKLIELAADFDHELMDKFVHNEPANAELIKRAIRKGTLAGKLHPVFAGSALRNIGIQRLLDGVVAYLPSPLEKPDIVGHKPGDEKTKITVRCDPNGSFAALAFKIIGDAHGDLYFLRIYQGTLKTGRRVLNSSRGRKENITRIFEMNANERKILESASAGEIVGVVGLKHTLTGDTVCDTRKPLCLESIKFPNTVINMSIEPSTASDRLRLAEALGVLRREDPTFEYKTDPETGQTIISGMGELHLEVLENKLVKEKGVKVRVGKPRVAYKETITATAEAEGKFIRQTGGRGQYGHVVLRAEPLMAPDGSAARDIEFVNQIKAGAVPSEYIPAVEKGVKDGLGSGELAGFPVVGVKVTLLDGSFHSVDSSDIAFEQAAAIAVRNLLKKANSVLLEPVMRLQAEVPQINFGAVQGNLVARRAEITDCHIHGKMRIIDAKVPLAEMFGYSSDIRSLTAGRGTFTMEPFSYQKAPEHVTKQILF